MGHPFFAERPEMVAGRAAKCPIAFVLMGPTLLSPGHALMCRILIYGANGYTGELIVALAVAEGCQPLLAGRSLKKIESLAGRYKLPFRIFDLDDAKKIASNIADVAVVLNCAGPFTRTASAIAEACIQEGVHYLDITGEVEVFELLAAMGDRARSRGVMLMPGVGFDVVPSDCLAAHLKRRMPDAVSLTLAFQASGKPSHGTATTMVENLHRGGLVRRSGRLVAVPSAARVKEVDFGYGQIKTMSIPPPGVTCPPPGFPQRYPTSRSIWWLPWGYACCQRHQGTWAKYWQHHGYRTTSNEKLTRDHPAPTRCNGVVVFRASGVKYATRRVSP